MNVTVNTSHGSGIIQRHGLFDQLCLIPRPSFFKWIIKTAKNQWKPGNDKLTHQSSELASFPFPWSNKFQQN